MSITTYVVSLLQTLIYMCILPPSLTSLTPIRPHTHLHPHTLTIHGQRPERGASSLDKLSTTVMALQSLTHINHSFLLGNNLKIHV